MVAALLPKAMNEWGEKIRKFVQSQDGLNVDETYIEQ